MEEVKTESGCEVCAICRHESRTQRKLKRHYKKKHKEYVLFCCQFCALVTVDQSEIKRHKRAVHPQDRIVCSYCDFSTTSWKKWNAHEKFIHQANTLTDDKQAEHEAPSSQRIVKLEKISPTLGRSCKRKKHNDQERNEYKQDENKTLSWETTKYVASNLDHKSRSAKKLDSTLQNKYQNGFERHKCHQCNKLFPNVSDLSLHQKEHHLFCCQFCALVTVDHSEMKKHKRAEHPQDRIVCSYCDFSTRSWKKWNIHENLVHQANTLTDDKQAEHETPSSPRIVKQEKIIPSFVRNCKRKVYDHQENINPYLDKRYKRKKYDHQERNEYKQDENRTLSWETTKNVASTSDNESQSARKLDSTLQNKYQNGFERHKCHQCNMLFPNVGDLALHQKEHHLLCCQFCALVTVDHSEMKKHKRAEHPQDRIVCSYCDFSTTSWKKWNTHENLVHQENTLTDDKQAEHEASSSARIVKLEKISPTLDRSYNRKKHNDQERNEYKQDENKTLSWETTKYVASKSDQGSRSAHSLDSTLQDKYQNGFESHKCHQCNKSFPNISDLTLHQKENTLFCCQFCALVTVDQSEIKKHMRTEHPLYRLLCSYCDFSTTYIKKWNAHEKLIHQANILTFDKPAKHEMLSSPRIVKLEKINPRLDRSYKRKKHDHQEKNEYKQDENKNVPWETTKYVASNSDQGSRSAHNLDSTLQDKSQNGFERHTCHQCNKSFPSASDLSLHQQEHPDLQPIESSISNFSKNHSLKPHQPLPSDASPYYCKLCNKQLARTYNLKRHLVTHRGDHPFHCPYCDYVAAEKATLVEHVRTHKGIKPFACNFCDYTTAYRTNIAIHSAKHSVNIPFSYQFCDKRFKRKGNLRVHVRSKHDEVL